MARAKKMGPVTRGARSQSPVRAMGELAGKEAAAEKIKPSLSQVPLRSPASGASPKDTADGASSAVSSPKRAR